RIGDSGRDSARLLRVDLSLVGSGAGFDYAVNAGAGAKHHLTAAESTRYDAGFVREICCPSRKKFSHQTGGSEHATAASHSAGRWDHARGDDRARGRVRRSFVDVRRTQSEGLLRAPSVPLVFSSE